MPVPFFGVIEEGQAAWTTVFLSLGLSALAFMKVMGDAYNARQLKKAEDDAKLSAEKLAIEKAARERADKRWLDSTIIEIKQKMEACDDKHAECEEARKADSARFEEKFRQHQLEARERAVAVIELQRNAGLPVTVTIPPPPGSGTHLVQPERIVDDPIDESGKR